jgi:CRP/FNR family transcriptional regulator, cyclic AMP receptor protein
MVSGATMVSSRAGHHAALDASPILSALSPGELSRLFAHARTVRLRRDETLVRLTDDLLAIVLDGYAVSALVAPSGSSVVTGFLAPGAGAGLSVVLGQPGASSEVTALTPLDAIVVRGVDVREHLAESPALATACMRTLNEHLADACSDLARFAETSTSERIVNRLLELADRWGEPIRDGIRIRIPLTQEMLASWSRSSRESTGKLLHDLRIAGVLRTARRELVITDLERLRARLRVTDDDSSLLHELLGRVNNREAKQTL